MKKLTMSLLFQMVLVAFLAAQNPRNVLIYNLTSTNCGPCSCMDSILGRVVLPAYPATIVVALHGSGSKFNTYRGDSAIFYFKADYEPSGFIDGLGYDVEHAVITDSVAKRYQYSSEAPVKIAIQTKTWDPATRKVDVTMNLTNLGATMTGSYRINVIVTEDHIHHPHWTAKGCVTPDDPSGLPIRNDYFNNWVTRSMVYYSKGDHLVGPTWPAQQTVTRNCSFSIDTSWVPQNCNFVVVVYREADSLYKANVQQAVRQSVTNGIGISEISPDKEPVLKIFPNPSKGLTNIHFSVATKGECRLSVLDMNGQLVETLFEGMVNTGLYNVETDTRKYSAGGYFVVLNTPDGSQQTRFVVP
jgi:hypothetical protein